MNKARFVDRDGVINDLVDRELNFFSSGKKVRWTAPFNLEEFVMKPNIEKYLNDIKKLGYLIILVSNQPDIAYGDLTIENHQLIMKVVEKLPFDDIYICPHGRNDGCECKKPKPGMILAAANKWNIKLDKSFMLGDSVADMQAATAAHCRSIVINDDKDNSGVGALQADYFVKNFDEIIKILNN